MTGEECVSKLRFSSSGQDGVMRLSREEEIEIARTGDEAIKEELSQLFHDLELASVRMGMIASTNRRINSLVWVYTEIHGARVVTNIRIAGMRKGLSSINEIAATADMNASFLGKIIRCLPGGNWNFMQVMKISTAVNLDSRTMLFSDLSKLIDDEDERYKSQ